MSKRCASVFTPALLYPQKLRREKYKNETFVFHAFPVIS
ncbi:hypothetical protein KKH3_39030 [Pectobacterium actinidiae]|nr:hypothetical protein KKH3_39030 [Pectobacterium actinidiae]